MFDAKPFDYDDWTNKDSSRCIVGDTVEVINTGQFYTTYTEMARKLGIAGIWNYQEECPRPKNGHAPVGTVIVTDTEPEHRGTSYICAVSFDNGKTAFLVNNRGIKTIYRECLDEKLFEL